MAGYYPPVGFYFRVEFALPECQANDARFQSVSGLQAEVSVEELVEGGENRFSHRLPGRAKYGNLVLKRGFLKDSGLVKWIRGAIESLDIKPVDVTISLLNEEKAPLASWSVVKAYPVKWSVSEFKAQENGFVTETLELAYQYFNPKS